MLRKILLAGGITSTLLYVALMAVVGYPGYNPISQTVSELSAVGAPSRPVAVALTITFDVLTLVLALGIWLSVGRKRMLHIVAAVMFASAIFDLSLGPFASMQGQGETSTKKELDAAFMALQQGKCAHRLKDAKFLLQSTDTSVLVSLAQWRKQAHYLHANA